MEFLENAPECKSKKRGDGRGSLRIHGPSPRRSVLHGLLCWHRARLRLLVCGICFGHAGGRQFFGGSSGLGSGGLMGVSAAKMDFCTVRLERFPK